MQGNLGQLERQIEAYFCKKVKTVLGGLAVKLSSPGHAGMPDRIVFLHGGRIAFVELKGPKGRLSKLQEKVISWMALQGYDVEVLASKDEVDQWIGERQ